jgi:hypothetical protein
MAQNQRRDFFVGPREVGIKGTRLSSKKLSLASQVILFRRSNTEKACPEPSEGTG